MQIHSEFVRQKGQNPFCHSLVVLIAQEESHRYHSLEHLEQNSVNDGVRFYCFLKRPLLFQKIHEFCQKLPVLIVAKILVL